MAGGAPVGLVYCEVGLDYTPYTRAQKKLLKDATTTTLNIEKSFTDLGIKSSKTFDLMRAKIHNAYNRIANDAKSSAADIIRAEKAKNEKLKQLNDQQFGAQTSLIAKLKKNWISYSIAIYTIQRSLRAVRSEFKDFESALVDMGKVTDRPLKLIRKDIMSINPVLGDATSLVKGYYQTISAGVTDPVKALNLLTTAAKAANAAHVDQSEVIKALTKMIAGFSGEVKTASDAADLLFRIEKLGQTTVAELVPIIGDISTASREAGVSQYEMAAALAQVSLTAGGTAEAATQYKSILMGLLRPNEKLQEVIENLGYSTSIAMVKQLGFATALQKIRAEADRAGIQIGKFFRSSEGMLGLAALSVEGFEEYRRKIEEVKEGVGSAEKAFNSWQLTSEALDKELDANFKRLMVELGGTIMPTLNETIKGLNIAMPKLSNAINTATKNFTEFWQAAGLASAGIISWKTALLGGDGAIEALQKFNMELSQTAKIFKINEKTKGWDIYQQQPEKTPSPGEPSPNGGGAAEGLRRELEQYYGFWSAYGDTMEDFYTTRSKALLDRTIEDIEIQKELEQGLWDWKLEKATEYDEALIEGRTKTTQDLIDLEAKGQAELAALTAQGAALRKQMYISFGTAVLQIMGVSAKKIFMIQKALEVANTIMNAYAAAELAEATIPPPMGEVIAAQRLRTGLMRAAIIGATAMGQLAASSGGGVGGGTYVSPMVTTPVAEYEGIEAEKTATLTINIEGDFIGDEGYIEKLAEKISEAVEDKDVTLIASNAKYAEALT